MLEPANLFDPRHYERQRRPHLEARTLPRWCYTSPEFYRREVERIFLKAWLFVGRTDEMLAPGDYLVSDTPGGSVIVMRGNEGEVRAFANTCRHRGARLLTGAAGHCERVIICPYHGWTYGLDGALRGAADMHETAGFELARFGLAPLRVATWQGFIWISFDPEIEPLESYFGDLFARYESYNFADMLITRRSDYEIACNWKLLIDNAEEEYHTGIVHKTSLGTQIAEDVETRGNWDARFLPGEMSVAVLPEETTPFPFIAGLAPELARGTSFAVTYPNTHWACVQDCMWFMTLIPLGPERCLNRIGFCFPRATAARRDFEEVAAKYYHRWDVSIDEDNATGELQHEGLRSVLREPGPYSRMENVVHRFANWVLNRVLDG